MRHFVSFLNHNHKNEADDNDNDDKDNGEDRILLKRAAGRLLQQSVQNLRPPGWLTPFRKTPEPPAPLSEGEEEANEKEEKEKEDNDAEKGGNGQKNPCRRRRRRHDPFFLFARNSLVEAGFIEIAGRRVDDDDEEYDDDDDDYPTLLMDEQDDAIQEGADPTMNDDQNNNDEDDDDTLLEEDYENEIGAARRSSADFSGWSGRKRRKPSQSQQYFQIYKDMQHQYGMYLASLPVQEGGFACLEVNEEEEEDEEEVATTSMAMRELDTLKRWNGAMANGNHRQLIQSQILEPESMQRTNPAAASASTNRRDERLSSAPSKPSWMSPNKKGTFDDTTVYCLQMFPTHLMQCGNVMETARILMNPRFFLARVLSMGAFEAANRHRSNLEEMTHRSRLARDGQYEQGGDGDAINPTDVMYASVSVMKKTLKERYPLTEDESSIVGGEQEEGDVGRALHLIATFLADQDDSSTSIDTYRHALRYKVAALGADHATVGRTYRHMGHQYLHQYDYKEAIECYSESVRIEQLQDDVDFKRVILSLNSMGMIYGMTSRPDKVKSLLLPSVKKTKNLDLTPLFVDRL